MHPSSLAPAALEVVVVAPLTLPKVGYRIGPSMCAPREISLVIVPCRSSTLNDSMGEYPVDRRASLRARVRGSTIRGEGGDTYRQDLSRLGKAGAVEPVRGRVLHTPHPDPYPSTCLSAMVLPALHVSSAYFGLSDARVRPSPLE